MLHSIKGVALASCITAVAAAAPARAQEDILSATDDLTTASAIAEAATKLAGAVEDRLLIKDLIGKELKGKDGETLGTVEDFVVVAGGRLIAAMVKTEDDERLAVPFAAVKVAGSAEDAGLELPIDASELEDMDELRSLTDALED